MKQAKFNASITNRGNISLLNYFKDIGKIALITPEDEIVLVKEIANGNSYALDRLIKTNLRFVVSIAKQYQNSGLCLEDLINEGNIGLIKAAKRFDVSQGFRFISYAVWWIRQSITSAIAEQSRMIYLPMTKIDNLRKLKKAAYYLEQILEREPSIDELAAYLGMSSHKLNELFMISEAHISLYAPCYQDVSLLDVIPNSDPSTDYVLDAESCAEEVRYYMEILSIREREIIVLFFGIDQPYPLTLEEISDRLGLSRERIRQIKEKAIQRIQNYTKLNAMSA
jgi:RNA polymerase primary sigma factor